MLIQWCHLFGLQKMASVVKGSLQVNAKHYCWNVDFCAIKCWKQTFLLVVDICLLQQRLKASFSQKRHKYLGLAYISPQKLCRATLCTGRGSPKVLYWKPFDKFLSLGFCSSEFSSPMYVVTNFVKYTNSMRKLISHGQQTRACHNSASCPMIISNIVLQHPVRISSVYLLKNYSFKSYLRSATSLERPPFHWFHTLHSL